MDAIQQFAGAFSIGYGKKDAGFNLRSDAPGVGKYDVNEDRFRPRSQQLIFSKANRESRPGSRTPSVGQYNIESTISTIRAPAYSIQSKPKTITLEKQVGPSTYDPVVGRVKSRQPAYSFTHRNDYSTLPVTPGPAQYETVSEFRARRSNGRGFTLAERPSGLLPNFDLPGPDSYTPTLPTHLQRGTTACSMGGAPKSPQQAKFESPGPGKYETHYPRKPHKGTHFGSKSPPIFGSDTPGPAGTTIIQLRQLAYPSRTTMSALSTRIGKALKIGSLPKDSVTNPGPGFYEVSISTSRPRTFHKSKRPSMVPKDKTPGPGSYLKNFSSLDGHKVTRSLTTPQHTLQFKRKQNSETWVPGPGHYDPTFFGTRRQSAIESGFTEGQRSNPADMSCTPETVGPGNYNPVLGKSCGSRFSKESRWKYKNHQLPGPGFYNIGGNLGRMPRYMLLAMSDPRKSLQ